MLWLCARRLPSTQRNQVWLCVVIATGFEVLGSIVIGFYRYRLHNVPLYAPPGHGLVYLFGVTAAATPIVRRHARTVELLALAACSTWAVAGLTVLPLASGRLDLQGALCLPFFAGFLLFSRRGSMFAAIFLITAVVELVGTAAGDWAWLPVAPISHLTSGNPPSAMAAGYCVIDSSIAAVTLALSRLGSLQLSRVRRRSTSHLRPAVAGVRLPEPGARSARACAGTTLE
ncbi:MAG TPA: hypothetical protein VF155_05575 [Candidatus Dormibacteraeota bacterium]